MRLTVLAMTVPILFGLISATGELARYGYGFFVFRSAGTGATQQGRSGPAPSQPSAADHPHRIGSGLADPQEVRNQQIRKGTTPKHHVEAAWPSQQPVPVPDGQIRSNTP